MRSRQHRITTGLTIASGLALLTQGHSVAAQGKPPADKAFGAYLSSECVTCHQVSGKAVGAIPPIVGMPEDQFSALMDSYRKKERDNTTMQTIATKLSDAEIAALGAYFGGLKPKP